MTSLEEILATQVDGDPILALKRKKSKKRKTSEDKVVEPSEPADEKVDVEDEPGTVVIESDHDEATTSTTHKPRRRVLKRKLKKHSKDMMARSKPDPVLDKDKERELVRIATRGVVQLFNTVKEHNAFPNEDADETVKLKRKTEFLDKLKKRTSDKESNAKRWKVLSEDFLTEADNAD